jgi:hypothetical protein
LTHRISDDIDELFPKPGWCGNFVPNGKSLGKSGPRPAFSGKFKVAFPKAEVLGKPLIFE